MPSTRLVGTDDAAALADLVVRNRDFLAPWMPLRAPEFFTEAGQRAMIEDELDRYARGATLPRLIVDDDGAVIGRSYLNGIVYGAFRSCSVAYWVDAGQNGRGVATAALREMIRVAFDELALHRVQAETLLANAGSQRVLAHCGFVRIGTAPDYLKIAGRWQDHVLWQLIDPAATD
ncbi:ribosomal-protein-alanine acetyltransferase [Actinocatenispora thailandica]|uniref:Ribosomal-protein-alanine acetyltransferase n=1 Tax=Actinocatenispora thailandica TaxID=227318 RepID=A0A7R7DJE7_9ACTN|nr:GNAT family protein [Actinocatenispora thailandica]BCJ32651.1 ribosomal-protein-alanine acetyltransferase [Actinocatenispora thailandica]